MNIAFIITIIIILLVLSVVVTGIIQKREQIAAEKKQRASQYYYQAKNAQDMIDSMRFIPISSDIIQFLLSYIVQCLKTARTIWPKLQRIDQDIERSQMHLQGYKPKSTKRIPLPTDEQTLTTLTVRLNKFINYLKNLVQTGALPENYYQRWYQKLYKELARIEIEGPLKLASRALEKEKAGTAKSFVHTARTKLEQYQVDSEYRNAQLETINSILNEIEHPQGIEETPEDDENHYHDTSKEGIQLGDSEQIFDEKKKW